MVYGYYFGIGKVQVVMVYINVGLVNVVCGVINLVNSNILVLIFGGCMLISEYFYFGCCNMLIGYGQEMCDQVVLICEFVKWDFELWLVDQIGEYVDWVWVIVSFLLKGLVYLSLLCELLCEIFVVDEVVLQVGFLQQLVCYVLVWEDIVCVVEVIVCVRYLVIFVQCGV